MQNDFVSCIVFDTTDVGTNAQHFTSLSTLHSILETLASKTRTGRRKYELKCAATRSDLAPSYLTNRHHVCTATYCVALRSGAGSAGAVAPSAPLRSIQQIRRGRSVWVGRSSKTARCRCAFQLASSSFRAYIQQAFDASECFENAESEIKCRALVPTSIKYDTWCESCRVQSCLESFPLPHIASFQRARVPRMPKTKSYTR